VSRTSVALFGYVYAALAVTGLGLLDGGGDSRRAGAALFSLAAAAFLWFLGSLRSRLMRYDPDGFFAAIVVVGGAAALAVQVVAVALVARTGPDDVLSFLAALGAPASATVVIASSLAALQARKVTKPFGRAGILGGVAILGVGFAEAADSWTLTDTYSASWLGFMIWVVVTTTYLLRR
jgi:hypothetical protein